TGKHPAETFHRILRGAYAPPSRIALHLPPSLDGFFKKAFAQRPEDRFLNAADMAAELRAHVEAASNLARPEPWHPPVAIGAPLQPRRLRPSLKRRIAVPALAIAALAAAALASEVVSAHSFSDDASPQPP